MHKLLATPGWCVWYGK